MIDQFLDDLDHRGLPGVVDVFLAGKTHDHDLHPVEALSDMSKAPLVEVDDMHLHETVDPNKGLDETVQYLGGMGKEITSRRVCMCGDNHDVPSRAKAKEYCTSGFSFILVKLWG